MLAVRDYATRVLIGNMADCSLWSSPDAAHVQAILFEHLVVELLALYQGHAMLSRYRRMGFEPGAFPKGRYWARMSGMREPVSHLPQVLEEGLPGRTLGKVLRKPFQLVRKKKTNKNALAVAQLKFGPKLKPLQMVRIRNVKPYLPLSGNRIISTKRGHIISAHAAQVDVPVQYLRYRHWFQSVRSSSLKQLLTKSDLDRIVLVAGEAFAKGGEALPENLEAYFRGWLSACAGLVGAHLSRLRQRPAKLPLQYWGGTGGPLWERMLRLAVRERGGRVTGHAHAYGAVYVESALALWKELYQCNRYGTYTARQAGALSSLAGKEPWAGNGDVEIFPVIPHEVGGLYEYGRGNRRLSKVRSVMYISTMFDGDGGRIFLGLPDIVAADLQVRLVQELTSRGYDTIIKDRPDMPKNIRYRNVDPDRFRVDRRPYENVAHEADVIIMIGQNSTTFNVTMMTDKPVVYIDLDLDNWDEGALDLLRRRCPVVRARFDDGNMVSLDWDELAEAIEASPSCAGDTAFYEKYLA